MTDQIGTFVVNHLPYLVAVGNDVLLTVDRSLGMSVTDPRFRPVADHISDHGMVLLSTEQSTSEPGIYGRVEKRVYATPEARNLLMSPEEETQE